MTAGSTPRSRPLGCRAAGLATSACVLASACFLASCSSGAPRASTTIAPATSTTLSELTVPGHPRLYRAEGVAVVAAFPGTPVRVADPATFAVVLPSGSRSVAWSIGDLGTLTVHSYELVIAAFPPGTSLGIIDDFLTHYGGKPDTTRYGRPGLHRLDTVPLSGATRYSGITAFSVGRVLVIAVGLDAGRAEVSAFTASVRLVAS